MIARGISEITGLQIDTRSVVRTKANVSQIGKGRQQRQENVEGIFSVADSDALKGKHVLVVDDVLTTGATTISLISEIQKVCDAKCSVLTMAVASN
jgi:predicted amidophosphoribosyltransferase